MVIPMHYPLIPGLYFRLIADLKEDLAALQRTESYQFEFLFMESDANTNYSDYRHQFSSTNSSQNNSGLLKYRSAPSFLLENFTNGVEKGERLTSRLFSDDANSMHELKSYNTSCNSKGSVNGFAALNSQLPPQYPRQNGTQLGSLAADGVGYRVVSSMGMDHQGQGNMGSNILRQNSTPAGLFSDLTLQHGYASIRGTGSYRMADSVSNGDLSPSSRLINRTSFSSGMPSSVGMLSRITEVENENTGVNGPDDAKVGNGGGDSLFYSSGFPFSSWNDSSNFAENFCNGIKRELDDDQKLFGHTQNGEPENRPHIFSRRLSLPKTSSEIAAMEKLLQLQDTVPCKVRAKRGCATHPRSIAERVRRTRISERMRKLQELVPNMDKQTNTADMLDLAVDYIKNLQKQYKTLCDNRANCKCSASQKTTVLNQMPWKEE